MLLQVQNTIGWEYLSAGVWQTAGGHISMCYEELPLSLTVERLMAPYLLL